MKMTALVGIVALTAFNLTTSAAEPTTATKTSHHVKHHRKQSQVPPKDPYAALEPYRSFGFIGEYPGDYALRRSLRECAVDLGYGRWESCNSDRN
jgi:hypothetical protein